jgi:hypothetical protein
MSRQDGEIRMFVWQAKLFGNAAELSASESWHKAGQHISFSREK